MSKSPKERIREFRERKKAEGFVEVRVWIPQHQVKALKQYAKSLNDQITMKL